MKEPMVRRERRDSLPVDDLREYAAYDLELVNGFARNVVFAGFIRERGKALVLLFRRFREVLSFDVRRVKCITPSFQIT